LAVVRYLGALLRKKLRSFESYALSLGSTVLALLCVSMEGILCYWYCYHSIKQIVYGAVRFSHGMEASKMASLSVPQILGTIFAAGGISLCELALARFTWEREKTA
jgi:hypothetical protein